MRPHPYRPLPLRVACGICPGGMVHAYITMYSSLLLLMALGATHLAPYALMYTLSCDFCWDYAQQGDLGQMTLQL